MRCSSAQVRLRVRYENGRSQFVGITQNVGSSVTCLADMIPATNAAYTEAYPRFCRRLAIEINLLPT